MIANKGDWVQIHSVILPVGERAAQAPQDTRNVPLEMWVKGHIMRDAELGETVEIKTATGRLVTGELVAVRPGYTHDYGVFVPELLQVSEDVKRMLYDDNGKGAV